MLLIWLMACPRPEPEPEACEPVDEAPPEAVTTLTRRLEGAPREAEALELNPVFADGLAVAEELGLGVISEAPGEARMLRDELAPGHGAGGPDRRSLTVFLHHTDAQLADVESPTRVVGTDSVGMTQSAARPQELYAIHALDAQIRTANALSAIVPIDFAVATGDNADSTQENELRWFAGVWDGTPVHPDAGTPGDQLDEDCHDPIAEFTPTGADFPYYVVAGNHDVLVQGNFLPDTWTDDALAADAPLGTRDLSQPGAPLVYVTEADPGRRLLDRGDIAAVLLESPALPAGHGFSDTNVADGTVNWVAHPVEGAPLVVVAVDANPSGPGSAELSIAERDGFLGPALEAAEADGDLVILTSHYALGNVAMEGGGRMAEWIAGFPNVVLVLAGHTHANRIEAYGDADDAGAFWQIETSSSNDWPQQGRIVELVVNGDGTLSILTTVFDHASAPGSMAARARELALIDLQSGWRLYDGSGDPEDRNTELVQRLPDGFTWTGGLPGPRSEALP